MVPHVAVKLTTTRYPHYGSLINEYLTQILQAAKLNSRESRHRYYHVENGKIRLHLNN